MNTHGMAIGVPMPMLLLLFAAGVIFFGLSRLRPR
jgi:hypothetical protein